MVKSHKKGGKWADGRRRLPDNLDELEGDPYKKKKYNWEPKEGWKQFMEDKKDRDAARAANNGMSIGPVNP